MSSITSSLIGVAIMLLALVALRILIARKSSVTRQRYDTSTLAMTACKLHREGASIPEAARTAAATVQTENEEERARLIEIITQKVEQLCA